MMIFVLIVLTDVLCHALTASLDPTCILVLHNVQVFASGLMLFPIISDR